MVCAATAVSPGFLCEAPQKRMTGNEYGGHCCYHLRSKIAKVEIWRSDVLPFSVSPMLLVRY